MRISRPAFPASVVASLVAALVALSGVALASAPAAAAAQVLTPAVPTATQHRQVLDGLNRQRAAVGAPPLALDPTLESVAQRWADVLGQGDGMRHNPALPTLLADFPQWGEIVATADMGEPDTTGMENGDLAVDSWMRSAPHRAVLQDAKFTSVGIGLVYTATRSGNRDVWRSYWVADVATTRRTPLVGQDGDGSRAYAGVPVRGAVLGAYTAAGAAAGLLGFPLAREIGPLRGGGYAQPFAAGSIYFSPASGAQVVRGAIRDTYRDLGWENGWLGYPTGGEFGVRGGAVQRFQGGTVFWSPATGARALRGAVLGTYAGTGHENGALGFPTTSETALRAGAFAHFQRGSVYWSAATGAHVVAGAVRDAWAARGWEAGPLGYPVGAAHPVPGGTRQDFRGGTITVAGGVPAVDLRTAARTTASR